MSCRSLKSIGVVVCVVASVALLLAPVTSSVSANAAAYVQQTDSAGAALREGRRLLKRGRADQALIQLRNALNLYTTAKNSSGMAAAHNELGDLYLRQGQYAVALENYQKALDGFLAPEKKDVVGAAVEVQVTYPHSFAFLGPVMRLISGGTFGTVTLRASSTMRCEAGCT